MPLSHEVWRLHGGLHNLHDRQKYLAWSIKSDTSRIETFSFQRPGAQGSRRQRLRSSHHRIGGGGIKVKIGRTSSRRDGVSHSMAIMRKMSGNATTTTFVLIRTVSGYMALTSTTIAF